MAVARTETTGCIQRRICSMLFRRRRGARERSGKFMLIRSVSELLAPSSEGDHEQWMANSHRRHSERINGNLPCHMVASHYWHHDVAEHHLHHTAPLLQQSLPVSPRPRKPVAYREIKLKRNTETVLGSFQPH